MKISRSDHHSLRRCPIRSWPRNTFYSRLMSAPRRSIRPYLAGKFWIIAVVSIVLTLLVWAVLHYPDHRSGPGEDLTSPAEGTWEMAKEYAPVLRFSLDERTFPAPVDYFFERSALVDVAGTVILEHPSWYDLEVATTGHFIEYRGDVIESYERDRSQVVPTVYARVGEAGGRVILQYWLFYVFNQGSYNSHQGDWEMVQVTMSSDGSLPEHLALSHHHGGSLIKWDRLTELNGIHPVVLVAAGSHANYLPGSGQWAVGDQADGLGEEWAPADYELVPIGTGAEGNEPSWLRFSGHWGEPAGGLGGMLGTEGPPGPLFRENGRMWEGVDWWR